MIRTIPLFGVGYNMPMKDSERLLDRITIEPGKCGGRPCIRGMRMRVSDVLELLASGATEEGDTRGLRVPGSG